MQWGKITTSIALTGTALAGGIDATTLAETPVSERYALKEEVLIAQKGDVVEASLPWKDQAGLKIKYDMGEPTMGEKLKDKRKQQVVTEVVGTDSFKIDVLLNEKPATNRFCYTIEGHENYDFFYQPALTPEEIEQGAQRAEEIVGSYAVYHKTLKNHRVGGVNYETGKVAHIPYPYVWSVNATSTTKHRAQDFSVVDGQMCVTVDSEWLNTAEYPVRVDPTFGYTSVGDSGQMIADNDYSGAGKSETRTGESFTTTEAGTMTSLSAYLSDDGLGMTSANVKAFVNERNDFGIEFVGRNTASDTSGGSLNIDLTALTGGLASSPAEGDIVVVVVGLGDTTNQTMSLTTSGYTTIADVYANDTYDANLGVFYKIMGATPDSSVVTPAYSISRGVNAVAYVWRGVDQTTPIDVTTTTASATNSYSTNAPSITPTTAGAMVLACGISTSASAHSTPSGMVNGVNLHANATYDSATSIASYEWFSGAYDPPAFGGGSGTASLQSWAAATVALRPASTVGHPQVDSVTRTGIDLTTAGWQDFTLTQTVSASEDYILNVIGDSDSVGALGVIYARFDSVTGSSFPTYIEFGLQYDSPESPWTDDVSTYYHLSIYATYTASGGGDPAPTPQDVIFFE